MRLLKERIEAMKAIWTQDEASYEGEFVSFDRIWSWPKPAQRPHPPVLVGGNGPTVEDRVLDFGDAWFPNWTGPSVLDRIEALRARAERPIDVMVMGLPADPALIERCLTAGCRRVVRWVPSGGLAVVEQGFERWEAAIAQVTGEG